MGTIPPVFLHEAKNDFRELRERELWELSSILLQHSEFIRTFARFHNTSYKKGIVSRETKPFGPSQQWRFFLIEKRDGRVSGHP
jgi:hypothetical protein